MTTYRQHAAHRRGSRRAHNAVSNRRFPDNSASVVADARLVQVMRSIYNPLTDLTPQKLRQALDQFRGGYLKGFYNIAHQMIETDDTLGNVADKRHRSQSTRGYEIIPDDDSDEAQAHAEALTYFYGNLSAVDAVDPDHVGEFELLVTQMMEAVSYRYACHEVVWQPSLEGVTAQMRYCPLSFFERTQGRLRYLPNDTAVYGENLDPDRWLVTVGPGLMFSCSITHLFKHTPLRDWLIYCSRHGMPGIAGKTSARPGSTEWSAMGDAVADFAAEFAAVMSNGDTIEAIDLTSKGEIPYEKLIERCDRAMASRYRGADLSSMSGSGPGENAGASLQGGETDIIEASDTDMINGTLRRTIDRRVIWYRFGVDHPKAKVQIRTNPPDTTTQDLTIDETLHRVGFPITLRGLSERYNRPLPDSDDPNDATLPPLQTQAPVDGFSLGSSPARGLPVDGAPIGGANVADIAKAVAAYLGQEVPAANASPNAARQEVDGFVQAARETLAAGVQADFEPLATRLGEVLDLVDDEATSEADVVKALEDFRAELPEWVATLDLEQGAADAMADVLVSALANAMHDTDEQHRKETDK